MAAATPGVGESPESKPSPRSGGLGEGAVASPTAGEAPTVRWIKIDLQDLYSFGHLDRTAARVLEEILEIYNVSNYVVVLNLSPDAGADVLVGDEEFKRDIKAAYYPEDFDRAVMKLAVKLGAEAIVELFDGYEIAFALLLSDDAAASLARRLDEMILNEILSVLAGGEEE